MSIPPGIRSRCTHRLRWWKCRATHEWIRIYAAKQRHGVQTLAWPTHAFAAAVYSTASVAKVVSAPA